MTIGVSGTGTVNVRNSGAVVVGDAELGLAASAASGTLDVNGAGSSFASAGEIHDGISGVGTINLSNKGALTDTNAILGLNPSGTGTVNMTDISTSWNNSGDLDIGSQGTGILNISSGATSNEVNTILGHSAGATGTAHIDGAGSFLNSTNALTIGNMGDGTLILSNGAFAAGLTGVTLAATGGSHGKLVIGADIGQTATGAGFLTGSTPTVQFGGGTGTLVFNHTSSNYTFAQVLQGSGNIEQLAGVTHLTGDGSGYGGNVHVGGGTLYVDNSLGGFGPAITNVTGSGRLGGTGTIHGAVDIADGATLVGVQGQKLTIDGPLTLHNNSIVDATLTNPSATALFDAQDLTLDGKLNITAHGTFGPGIYRLFDYHNSITDNGLDIGTTPDGTTAADFSVHTDTTNKVVYLEDDAAAQLRFWDGNGPANNNVVDGGTGTWTATSMNFTDGGGTTNGVQTPQPGFVVFQTAAGTVTADDSAGQVGITGMQFAIDGYTVAGDAISLANAQTTLRVGDGSGASSAFNATISAVLSGTGGLNKTDLGTATLTTANTYTGLTTISQGLLALQGAGSISASSGLVDNGEFKISGVNGSGALITSLSGAGVVTLGNKALALTAAADSFGGSINGSGGLTVAGGTEVLTGVQGYTGSTTISSGAALAISGAGSIASSLQVIADGTLNIAGANGPVTIGGLSGAGAVQLGANKLATHDNGNFSGVISGAGGLHVTGGIETLRGANTYTGGTTIDANSGVELGFNDATGSILGDVVNNGLFATNRTDSNTVANNISGIGQFAAIGTGITTLTGTNTYTGGTVDLFGTLVGSATSFGSGAIQDGFAVVLDQPTDATFANDISGSGTFEKKGAGVLAYTGAGTWTGDTTISAGTLQIGNGGTAGSLVGNVVDNGTLAFDRSDAVSFTGQLSGTGGLSQIGTGTTTLTSAETYTGLTTVSAGTLQLTGAGSINSSSGLVVAAGATFDDSSANGGTSVPTLSGDGNVGLGANTLTLTNAAGAFGGVISGTGGLVKQGTGSFNLTGASTYSGPTTVSAGRLAVNGSIANSIVTVQNGATLGGNGTVKGVIAQSGAIVAPGNSIGTLNVAGNYSQAAGSTYQVELTSTGQNDKINATGTATIENGAMLAVTKTDAADYVQGTRYTVLTAAGGVNGAYTLSGDLVTAVYGLAAHYDATHVYLDVFRAKKFVDFATTPNQTASGAALDTLPANGALTHALSNLMADADVTAALDKVSGEIHASAKTAELEDSRFPREAALGRLSTAFAQGETDSMHPSLWGQAYGSWGTNDGNGNAASLNHSSRGFLGGVDLPVANIWRVGFMGGYSRGSFNVKDRSSTGTSDNYHLSAYAGMQQGALGVRFGAAYSWHDLTTDRTVAFSGFNNDLVSQYNADTKQVYGEVGYHVPVAKVDLEPFANVAYVSLQTGPILETGGAAALTGKADTQNVTFTTLGLRGKYDITLGDTVIGTHANAGWRHAFGDLTPLSVMSFAGSSAFTIQAVPLAQDGAAYGAGFDLSVAKDVLLGVSYDGQYAPSANDNTIKLNVDWKL
jgi:outer membrane autotransporter protein